MMGYNCKNMCRRASITLDFKKAFDMVRWDVIDVSLEIMGFDYIFRRASAPRLFVRWRKVHQRQCFTLGGG